MPLVLALISSSPRVRRRLVRLACAVVVLAGVAAAAVLVPRGHPTPEPAAAPATAQPVPATPEPEEVPLAAADRRAINRTLDRFILTAVTRRDPAAAWQLAGPTLRAGTTPRDWARGDVPVFPFPAKGVHFHGWQPSLSYRDSVLFDLLIHPTERSQKGPISFTVEMKRRGGRWLVDGFVPVAQFSPVGKSPTVLSQADYAPGVFSTHAAKRKLNPLIVAVPFGLLGLILLVPVALGCLSWYRGRRAEAEYAAFQAGREALRRSAAR